MTVLLDLDEFQSTCWMYFPWVYGAGQDGKPFGVASLKMLFVSLQEH